MKATDAGCRVTFSFRRLQTGDQYMMMNSSVARHSFESSLRLLGGAAMALLMLSTATSQRAEALSPINPGISGGPAIDNGLTIEVHGGGGGGGGPAVHGGSFGTGHFTSSPGSAGRGFGHGGHHGFRHRHGFFVGGIYYDDYPYDYDYPYYDYPAAVAAPGCRIVPTAHGPRQVCYRAVRHHRHYRHYAHRRHHHA